MNDGRSEGDPARAREARLSTLVAHCLERMDREGESALTDCCERHPGDAAELRRRVEGLRQTGLLGNSKPAMIGPYTILEEIGEGGMGTVYLAEQREPIRRRVALKVIKLGMDSKAVIARFEQERQALALMAHDGIAKVYDCGTSERGQPFFVMELVKGVPLTDFCNQQRLPLPDRLKLMQQVCAAVTHAHQKGVVHRDLKPSNVLVCEEQGNVQIKIIDFGLAKALGQKLVEATLFTAAGQVIGTPEYMAPEQADPTNADIDTRADVYSLGVMLYEVLTGQLPFSSQELRQAGLLEMQRVLRDVEPKKPSTKLLAERTSATVAAQRRTSAAALHLALKNDLDWLVLKAIEKDRARRYDTANALAMDLQRYLEHEPLVAGPPTAGYRFRKLVRRYRGQVLAASAVLLALVGGGIGTFVQYLRAEDKATDALRQKSNAEVQERLATQRAEENERLARKMGELATAEAAARQEAQQSAAAAEQRANELEQVLTFQESQWSEVDSESMGVRLRRAQLERAKDENRANLDASLAGVNFTDLARGMLQENLFDRSLAAIEQRFAEQPLVKARLLQSVALTLLNLGMLDRATAPQAEALELRRRNLGDEHQITLISVYNMGQLLKAQGKLTEAEPFLREAMAGHRRILGDDHPNTLVSIINMGLLLQAQGELTEAEPFCREALEKQRRILGDDHPDTLISISNMGHLLMARGRLAEAEPYFREAMEGCQRVLGDGHAGTQASIHNLGLLLQAQGKLGEAVTLCRETLEGARRTLGDDHPSTMAAINNMGMLLEAQGKLALAEGFFREALAARRRIFGDDHPSTLTSINNLGSLLRAQGRLAEAEPFYREALATSRRILGDDHPNTLTFTDGMGGLLQAQGKFAEAEPLLREALEKSRVILGQDHPETLTSIHNMGNLLVARGQLTEAEPFLREAMAGFRRVLGDDHPDTLTSINSMGLLLEAQGKLAEAEELCREALAESRRILGDEHPSTLTSINSLGMVLQAQGKFAEAEPFLQEALETRRRILGDDHPSTLTSINNMGLLRKTQGKLAEAEPFYREAVASSRRLLGDDHSKTLVAILNMGGLLHAQGKLAEAEPLFREAVEKCGRVLGGDHPITLTSINSMGVLLRAQGRLTEAEPFLREALAKNRRILGDAHPNTLTSILSMGILLVESGRHRDAVALLSAAETAARGAFTGGNVDRLAAFLRTLGKAHAGLSPPQDFAAAEAKLREAHAVFTELRGPAHKDTGECARALVSLYEAWHAAEPGRGYDQQAAAWKAQLEPRAPEPRSEVPR